MDRTTSRRKFLQATTSVAVVISLTGCTTDSQTPRTTTPTEADDDSPTTSQTTVSDPEYSIEASLVYNLADLGIDDPETHDEAYVKENYSVTPEVALLEDGFKGGFEPPSIVQLETESGNTFEENIPEYAVRDGERVAVTAETENGQTLQTTTQVEKNPPFEYIREIFVDGRREPWQNWITNITGTSPDPYTTPYRFDTQHFTFEEFYRERRRLVDEISGYEGTIGATDAISVASYTDWSQFNGKQEKIAEASRITNSEMPGASAAAQSKAQTIEYILRNHTNIQEPIAAGGFDNPAADGTGRGNHGSQMIHADGDNYHSETFNYPGQNATHVDNIEELNMLSETANQGDYVSVVGELSPEFNQVSRGKGLSKLQQMLRKFTSTDGLTYGTIHDKEIAFAVRDKILENQFEQALLGNMIGSLHGFKHDENTHIVQTENTLLPVTTQGGTVSDQTADKLT